MPKDSYLITRIKTDIMGLLFCCSIVAMMYGRVIRSWF